MTNTKKAGAIEHKSDAPYGPQDGKAMGHFQARCANGAWRGPKMNPAVSIFL